MHGSTLPGWLIVLFIGVVVNIILGFFNPFISKRSKVKMKNLSKEKKSDLLRKRTVKIRYRFDRSSYMVAAFFMDFAAIILFIIDCFNKEGSIDCIFKLFCALIIFSIFEGIVLVVSIVLEQLKVNLLIWYYEKKYCVKIIKDETC